VNRVQIGRRQRPGAMAGDKGYSTPRIRQWLRRHAIRAVIPRRSDQHPDDRRVHFDRAAYRRRSTIEQCIGWIKECRRVATRFEKLAVNFLAMIHLVFIERYFRVLFSNGA
jgi:transposase